MTDGADFYLVTERCVLRNWRESDLDDLVALSSDPEVMRFLGEVDVNARADIRDNVFPTVQGYVPRFDGKFGNWIVVDRLTEEFIGTFLMRPDKRKFDDVTRLELGYRLRTKFWGTGIATEIALALIEKAWEFGAKEVFAGAQIKNRASIRVMEKIGMTFDCIYLEPEIKQADKTAARYFIRNPRNPE